jgi:uncharacterized protein (DUF1330 family)
MLSLWIQVVAGCGFARVLRTCRAEAAAKRKGRAMPAYVIYQAEMLDAERYEQYKALAGPSIVAAGGRYLVRGGDFHPLEGDVPAGRTVVVEFASMQAALEWYNGEEYTAIRKIREGAARARMYVVEGI